MKFKLSLDDDCDGDIDETDSDCQCSTADLLEVTVNTGSEIYTLYVHPMDQRTGFPESNGVQWGGYETDLSLMNKTLPVYKEVYALILLIYELTKHFPREYKYKYTIGQDMKRDRTDWS